MFETGAARRGLQAAVAMAVALLALAAGGWMAWHHPVAPVAVSTVFIAWCAVLFWRPRIWVFTVPAALPLLDFGPWTGWVAFEEFDLLLLGVAAGAGAALAFDRRVRDPAPRAPDAVGNAFQAMACVFLVATLAACWHGLGAADAIRVDGYQAETDAMNAWRIGKSVFFALLLRPLLGAQIREDPPGAARRFASGMVAGLVVVILAVAWERSAYPGFWRFAVPYRTVALFWEMHVGGAAIDAYLAAAVPFVCWALWTSRTLPRWATAAALALLACYACLTTFSRGVYLSVAVSLLLLGVLLLRRHAGSGLRAAVNRALQIIAFVGGFALALTLAFEGWGWAGALAVAVALASAAVLLKRRTVQLPWRTACGAVLALALVLETIGVLGLGSYMRTRLASSDHDMGGRLGHWASGIDLLRRPQDWLWGIGLGRLPATYAAHVPRAEFPGKVEFFSPVQSQPGGWFRLSGPRTRSDLHGFMALTQRVALSPAPAHTAAFDVRTAEGAVIYLELCEMHLLYPRHCQNRLARVQPTGLDWTHVDMRLHGPILGGSDGVTPRLGVFSLSVVNPGGSAEFTRLSLRTPEGAGLLDNGDFARGRARWFPAARGYYLPWHIDNLYLEILIERGLPAMLAFVLGVAIALWRLVAKSAAEVAIAPFLAAAVCGMLCVGLVSSIMDAPRVAFLLFLLLLFSVEATRPPARDRPALSI